MSRVALFYQKEYNVHMQDILNKLNQEQKDAVRHVNGPALIVAGAGTGKTTVITRRFLWLLENQDIKPENIVALTFTEKAAHEMQERIEDMLPLGYFDLWIHTFHGFCEKILKERGLDIGLSTDFRVINTSEQWILIKKHLDRFNLDYYKPLNNPTKFIQTLINHFSRCKDENITPQMYLDYIEDLRLNNDARQLFEVNDSIDKLPDDEKTKLFASELSKYSEIANAYHTYQQILLKNNYLDFGDLLAYTLKLFKEKPATLAEFRNQFRYILVDEFQDTNTAQYELVRMLASPYNNLMVVGDDDQSIYKFRGASIQNIMRFKDDYPSAKEIVLSKNYRSAQEVLDSAYKSIQENNPYRLEEKLNINKKLVSEAGILGNVEHLHGKTLDDEVEMVANKILEIKNTLNQNNQLSNKRNHTQNQSNLWSNQWSNFAILVRANNHANVFTQIFDSKQIPYEFKASKGLYIKPVIMDCISFLRVLYNFYDDVSMYRIINMSVLGIKYDDISKITDYSHQKGINLYDVLKQITIIKGISKDCVAKINDFVSLIQKYSKLLQQDYKVSDVFVDFVKESGYLSILMQEDTVQNYYSLNYLNQFGKKIKKFEENNTNSSLREFIDLLSEELESGETGSLEEEADFFEDKVQIMTIHSAKGLEFPYVFIVNMVDQRFPTRKRSDGIKIPKGLLDEPDIDEKLQHIFEERRLFYVAATRAKEKLFYCSADNYGGARNKKLSIFLKELGYDNTYNNEIKSMFNTNTNKEKVPKIDYNKVNIPKKFSFTQLADFNTCPLQYKYKYILKIPTKGNKNLSFGSTIHNTLEAFFKRILAGSGSKQQELFGSIDILESKYTELTKQDLFKIYDKKWINDWYESPKEQEAFKDLGKKMLSGFYDDYISHKPKCFNVEQAFNVKFDDYTIVGRIDRIDSKDSGEYEIVDYKTGNPKLKLEKHDKRQLMLYKLAAEQVLNIKVKELTYYYLANISKVNFVPTDRDINDLLDWIKNTIESIKKSDFEATPGNHCKYCSFNNICEFRM